ncbi:MAG: DoxX family protein [Anaerolineaceae bacterium]|nr:MAG: DoxX family protein [Anaerolineaceae bacterium]
MVDLATLTLRLFVGIVMILHGVHKLQTLDEVNGKWREDYSFPTGTVALVAVLQIVTGLAITLGIYIRYAALIQALIMVVATYVSIWKNREPFLSLPAGKGWDINLLLLGAFITLMLLGDDKRALLGQ